MDLESIYIELPDEAKDYYCSLRKSLSKNILNIVSDKYEFKLKKLIEKENKIHDDFNEKKNFNSSKNKRKSLLDQWISNNLSSRNTIQYKENIKELGELYFELRDSKRINEDAYNESIKLLGEEKEKI